MSESLLLREYRSTAVDWVLRATCTKPFDIGFVGEDQFAESILSDCVAAARAVAMSSRLEMPPWARSLLPPPRPLSVETVCLSRVDISCAWPGDCAKTSAGCGE